MYIFIHTHTHKNMYAGVFLLSLFDTLFLIPLNLPAVPREGFAGTAWPVVGVALAANA